MHLLEDLKKALDSVPRNRPYHARAVLPTFTEHFVDLLTPPPTLTLTLTLLILKWLEATAHQLH